RTVHGSRARRNAGPDSREPRRRHRRVVVGRARRRDGRHVVEGRRNRAGDSMSHGHTDQEMVARTHNTARFFTETRHIAWVLLIATMVWGVYGYLRMPQRKDPDIPIRQALALVPWPGASAERIEQLVTRKVEEKIGENARVEKIESNTRTGLTAIFITLVEGTKEVGKEFDDIKLKLDSIHTLPDGAGPITFVKDFGDTAALMLTVASPKTGPVEIALRAKALQKAIEQARRGESGRSANEDVRPGAPRPAADGPSSDHSGKE